MQALEGVVWWDRPFSQHHIDDVGHVVAKEELGHDTSTVAWNNVGDAIQVGVGVGHGGDWHAHFEGFVQNHFVPPLAAGVDEKKEMWDFFGHAVIILCHLVESHAAEGGQGAENPSVRYTILLAVRRCFVDESGTRRRGIYKQHTTTRAE